MLWLYVLLFVVALLVFGYVLDRKTDRYKSINDKKAKEGLETIKDDVQKQNPPNSNKENHWL
ncbi:MULTISPECIES: hypothetical protein [Bacillus]|uniref:hypothetical protein n=1 Tax=Bacillus TaxID=1386 RepID=UPI0012FF0B73|nr:MULTISPECIES: hypothetical protein [Bacillus]